ncbi:2-acylglycerol O-acyltransferase 1-like protein, partial [Leptotrombidium deliense]
TINDRKGFIKMALKTGASLVPVLSLGENDLYIQKERDDRAFVKKLQKKITSIIGFSPPFFHGRGVFQYSMGLLPFRKPVVTIVGKPINTMKTERPTYEQIDKLHETYVNSLKQLFEENKEKYGFKDLELVLK